MLDPYCFSLVAEQRDHSPHRFLTWEQQTVGREMADTDTGAWSYLPTRSPGGSLHHAPVAILGSVRVSDVTESG